MRKIIHIDADCFFAAVEMREKPELTHVPLAIGGSSQQRGVIATCNYPARRYGIHSAMSSAQALKLYPDLVLIPPNMSLYKQVSQKLMQILHTYSCACEVISIDEAYLEIPSNESASILAKKIKQKIFNELGIKVSAGIAENKLLAKIASDYNKPDGLTVIHPSKSSDFIKQLPVIKIPGVGKKFNQKLKELGVVYCHQAQNLSLEFLLKRFGKSGLMLYKRCRGIDERELLINERERKSISLEHTFDKDINRCNIHQALPDLWKRWCQRVEQKQLQYQMLSPFVKIKFSDFSQTTYANHTLTTNLNDFESMLEIASKRSTLAIRLIGIGGRIDAENKQQLALF